MASVSWFVTSDFCLLPFDFDLTDPHANWHRESDAALRQEAEGSGKESAGAVHRLSEADGGRQFVPHF